MIENSDCKGPSKGGQIDFGMLSVCAFAILAPITPVIAIVASQKSFFSINDLPEYYVAARLILEGRAAAVYDLVQFFAEQQKVFPDMGSRGVALFFPPFSTPLLLWLGLIPPTAAPVIWTLILLLSFLIGLYLCVRFFKLTLKEKLWTWSVVVLSSAVFEALRIGQISPILMLAAQLSYTSLRAGNALGASLALAVLTTKPQLLLPLAIFLIGARKLKTIAYLSAFGAALALASLILMGTQGYTDYIHLVSDRGSLAYMQPELSPTVRGQLMRICGIDSPIVGPISVIALIGSTAFLFVLGHKYAKRTDWLMACILAAMPIGIVFSLHSHSYDQLLLVPSAIALVKSRANKLIPPWLKLGGIAGMLVFMLPFYAEIHYGYIMKGGVLNPEFIVLLGYAATIGIVTWRMSSKNDDTSCEIAE